MNRLSLVLCTALFSLAAAALEPPIPLVDMFSSEKNPGRGTLEYVKGTETEKITLGAETGHYLLGFVFSNDTLPKALQAEWKGNDVIQLAWGTHAPAAGARITQFGAATLRVLREVQPQRTVTLHIPQASDPKAAESGFLLFSSPQMASQISDEEKLKGTFFAKSGSLVLSSPVPPRSLKVPLDGRKIPFKMQAMRMEVQAVMTTPFSSEEHQLRGRVEFPLYWPEGSEGKRLARAMAETAFQAQTTLEIPKEFGKTKPAPAPTPVRKLATPPRRR